MNCIKCKKEFFCTKKNFWEECKEQNIMCICYDCWKKSSTYIVTVGPIARKDLLRCYGPEVIVIDNL